MKSYGEFVAWLHAKPEADHRVLMMAHIEELHRALGTGPRSRFAPAPMAEETMSDDELNRHLMDILACCITSKKGNSVVTTEAIDRLRLAVDLGVQQERVRCVIEASKALEWIRKPRKSDA